jgi:hypothetical protein
MYRKYFAFDVARHALGDKSGWLSRDCGNLRGGIGRFYFRIGAWRA